MTTFNIINYINSLPLDIIFIDVSCKNLNYLPNLEKFKNLKILYCYCNQLTNLPKLNDSLEILECYDNKLINLPNLNENLKELYCSNNELINLPKLNNNLKILSISNNKLYYLPKLNENLKILYCNNYNLIYLLNENINIIKKNINILNKFRFLYYCLKFKKQFRILLWIKIREPKIKKKYNPIYLINNLSENDDLDKFLDNW
jgi:E3 ubiquitin-protein ligase SspH2